MNPDPSLVSVVTPAYNAQEYISDAIESVRSQTFTDWELIVVNDGSTDGTERIVSNFCIKDSRIRLVQRENGKLAKARNTGIASARGKFIGFLDADDVWQPDKLDKQMGLFQETSAAVIFSDAFHFPENRDDLPVGLFGRWVGFISAPEMFRNLYSGNAIPVSSVLVRRLKQLEDFRFDESNEIRGLEDYELWLRLASEGAAFVGMSDKLIGYRTHAAQMSRRIVSMLKSEMAVRQRYRSQAQVFGIDVVRQDRIDFGSLAYHACNEAEPSTMWSAIAALCNPTRFGIAGPLSACGPLLHAVYHFLSDSFFVSRDSERS